MVDSITATTGPFDTAAMQITQAQAHAATTHANEVAYLQEIVKTNDATNAQALDSTTATPPPDPFLTNDLFNLDAFGNPTAAPSNLAFLTEFDSTVANSPTSDSIKAQQLHDMGILQRDAVLLQDAAIANSHIPLNTGASTVDLSLPAQGLINGSTIASTNSPAPLTPTQLTQIGNILQPIANQPLTPSLLEQIQTQLIVGQNPIQLSLSTITLAMNLIAALQPSPYHLVENTPTNIDSQVVTAVTAVDKVAVEDSAIRK